MEFICGHRTDAWCGTCYKELEAKLALFDEVVEALTFYRLEAEAISKNLIAGDRIYSRLEKNTVSLMASMQVLGLDAGKRATDILAKVAAVKVE